LLEALNLVSKTIDKYQGDKDMLIQILLELQNEYGWLPKEMLREINRQLGVPLAMLYRIASFYKAFSLAPKGRHVIRVSTGIACQVRGAPLILNILQQLLDIEPGDTTPDMKFSLETVNCLGCCPIAPVVLVGENYHGKVHLAEVKDILDMYE
jgi:NADH-quinone oxidoreductase subunit E